MGLWHLECCLEHPQDSREPWECPTCGCRWLWDAVEDAGYVGDFQHPSWDWMFNREAAA